MNMQIIIIVSCKWRSCTYFTLPEGGINGKMRDFLDILTYFGFKPGLIIQIIDNIPILILKMANTISHRKNCSLPVF